MTHVPNMDYSAGEGHRVYVMQMNKLLTFVQRSLGGVQEEEVQRRIDELWSYVFPRSTRGDQFVQMSSQEVIQLQAEMQIGLNALVSAPPGKTPWVLPQTSMRLVRVRIRGLSHSPRIIWMGISTDERSTLLYHFIALLQLFGDRLRRCVECNLVFAYWSRQSYCDARCSMRVRNRRRLDSVRL